MATENQLAATKESVKRPQEAKRKTPDDVARSNRKQNAPGSTGEGRFYRIEILPTEQFVTFRIQDVADKGGIERLAGKRANGSWDTAIWLVSKDYAHIENKKLVADKRNVMELFDRLGSQPVHVKGDIFKASDSRDLSNEQGPAAAQRNEPVGNITKALGAGNNK